MDARKGTLVIGLGEIGRPLFELVHATGAPVHGIDVEPGVVPGPVAIMHLCYPFEIPGGFVATSVSYAEKYAPEVIVVNSTVVPGTTREIARRTGRPAVYSPVRGKHTKMSSELLRYTKFVAAQEPEAARRVEEHFRAAGVKTESMAPPEALELAKLLETTYFALLIAWAQEMNRFGERLGADYPEMARFFAEVDYLPRHVFVPGFIGGHCVLPNIALLKKHFSSAVLDAVLDSNERRARELGPAATARSERLAPIPRERD